MARRVDVVLKEILDTIDVLMSTLDGISKSAFWDDRFKQWGAERAIEIISEAVRHVPDEVLAERPEIPWADIRTIGNRIRHEYWRVDPEIVWDVARHDLPPLREAIAALLTRHSKPAG
ncbi:MAG: DUF86 domain-containing protein [Hyphomicrobiales bacterium]|nr:DUF86 domain-containing protein [Hyphomicrobiales bacterium]